MSLARLIVVSPEELSDGFRLTGVAVEQAETSPDAERIVRDLISSGESGVIAVYRPLFDGFDDDLRRRLKASVSNPTSSGAPAWPTASSVPSDTT